jgi:hypothetical protein
LERTDVAGLAGEGAFAHELVSSARRLGTRLAVVLYAGDLRILSATVGPRA